MRCERRLGFGPSRLLGVFGTLGFGFFRAGTKLSIGILRAIFFCGVSTSTGDGLFRVGDAGGERLTGSMLVGCSPCGRP